MKKVFILAINVYQKLISSLIHQIIGVNNACRFEISCSEYAKKSISHKGVFRGSYLSVVRVLKCQPFYSAKI